jgi:hypothetical protein
MNVDDWNQENGSDIDEYEDEINEGNNKIKKGSKLTGGLSEQTREGNKAKEQYLVPDDLVRKPAAKKPAAKEKKDSVTMRLRLVFMTLLLLVRY